MIPVEVVDQAIGIRAMIARLERMEPDGTTRPANQAQGPSNAQTEGWQSACDPNPALEEQHD